MLPIFRPTVQCSVALRVNGHPDLARLVFWAAHQYATDTSAYPEYAYRSAAAAIGAVASEWATRR